MKPISTCLLVAGLLLAQSAWAQSPSVTSTLQAHRVDVVAGNAVRKAADAGTPGDVVEYVGTYRNVGTTAAGRLLATIPVPVGTTFVEGSVAPAGAQASTDGVHFAAMPLLRAVRQPDGSTRQEPLPLTAYRYLRWDLGSLAPGGEAAVRLRVRIDSAPETATARP